jgi:hypothetical protein
LDSSAVATVVGEAAVVIAHKADFDGSHPEAA